MGGKGKEQDKTAGRRGRARRKRVGHHFIRIRIIDTDTGLDVAVSIDQDVY